MKKFKEIFKYIYHIGTKFRQELSRFPILYAFIGSVGVVLIWRGVWHIADDMKMSGSMSLVLGVFISIASGLFVSFFVGDKIIIAGIKHEKRTDEKTEEEIKQEEDTLVLIEKDLKYIKNELK